METGLFQVRKHYAQIYTNMHNYAHQNIPHFHTLIKGAKMDPSSTGMILFQWYSMDLRSQIQGGRIIPPLYILSRARVVGKRPN